MQARELNDNQVTAVRFDKNRPLIILAGAGSGKTKVLTHRAAYLIEEEKISPDSILLLTFTNKAAGEMMQRVKKLVGVRDAEVSGGTFHSFCLKLIRKYGQRIGISPGFTVFDEADQLETVKKAMQLVGVDVKAIKPAAILGAISDAKNNLVGEKEYTGYAKGVFQQTTGKVYSVYQKMLTQYNGLDFDDLLMKAVGLLKNDTEVLRQVNDRFAYILVDEYQDTNKAQYEITKLLAGGSRRLTVVGDAAQAIYSWRGADYKNLLYLKQDFPEITIINLEQNYRSTQNILAAANEIISKNKSHPILKLWTNNGAGDKVEIFQADDEIEEASFVRNRISETGSQFSNCAVLYRTNAQSRIIEEVFLHAGIPYRLFGGIRFYERREIKDLLAYLRLLVNPADEISKSRAEKVGKTRLSRLEASRGKIDTTANTIDILDTVIRLTQYSDQYSQDNEEDMMRLENIKELRSVAAQFTELAEFLQQIALTEKESKNRKASRMEDESEAVALMTAHSAKGLEFETVFMVGMEEGLFPHSRALFDSEQMEEERRLCYVGMTRAKRKLYLSYARRRLYFGQRNNNPVSRFVAEIPENLIKGAGSAKRFRLNETDWGFDESGEWKWRPSE